MMSNLYKTIEVYILVEIIFHIKESKSFCKKPSPKMSHLSYKYIPLQEKYDDKLV